MVFKYDDEEWANLVPPDPAWTREETDYLLDTCAVYQLRFLVIADRYDVRFSCH
jgi:DNA methyltransferase 1-associated protein 1